MNGPAQAMQRTARDGFSLAEAVVALVLVAVAAVLLLPITFNVALQTQQSAIIDQRTATLAAEAENAAVTDFDDLEPGTVCTEFSSSHFPHTRCVTVTDLGNNRKRVTIIVTPQNGYGAGPDTVVIERSRPGRYNPLNP